ncbi:bifunctional glutamate/proline--tRNA ligase [Drosophila grimshawi]|uniref:Bifunctional glutamate/proline--tRNA ligase n=1 Tax=Drosophila grimshawi TaxID=7222 RepID=B4JT86_DROGR|nr:bifunctional glutamate/proline--tRNA ligase [Drosophila grimshawi]EDV94976.1 GH23578 [Drosophila grimshawi]
MTIKLKANVNNPPISGLATAHLIKATVPVEIIWSKETSLQFPDNRILVCHSNNDVLRALARAAPDYQLYGETAIERTQIDHWLSFSLTCEDDISWAMSFLDKSIAPVTYLVANKLTIADFALFNEMHSRYELLAAKGIPQHVQRWYDLINAQPLIQKVLQSLPEEARVKRSINTEPAPKSSGERKQEGKFVELPGAEMGKVVVRFPPEASGYLHIGHAKAALLNQYYALAFQGKLIMRFDDTNPAKETVEFENVILGDLEMLQIKPDVFTHTSNYFDLMLDYCVQMLKEGTAYVDDTPPEQMKLEREQRVASENRSNSVEKNLSLWQEMLQGSAAGQKCCVRAKIDMSSPNGCMRDPTIYRCKNEPHPRTGTKYKVYPTYDFACPIVDAIENVTHTLRTMEYHDRDDQFYWFIDALKLRKPYIWEYSRLNMTNTVLSKRKLTWFVDSGLVDGWDDPRFPTVRGIIRRGMTVEGLREFIIAQGSSKSVVFMNWDKIWAFNKKVIDPIAPRYTALEHDKRVIVNVAGAKLEKMQVPVHPKDEKLGTKTVTMGPRIFIDYVDAEALKEGENATFINWGNLLVKKVNKDASGTITSVDAALNLENKDFKKTLKLTWLAVEDDASAYPPTFCVYFDNIISKAVLGKDEDFKQYIGHKTRDEVQMLGDPELKKCKKGDIIQLQRRGFFKVDNAYAPASPYTNVISPIILFSIPDGHTKDMPSSGLKINAAPAPVAKTNAASNKTANAATSKAAELDKQIGQQGDLVRELKAKKAAKDQIDVAVKKLLSLKADYKAASGQDWKPGQPPLATATAAAAPVTANDATDINASIVKQGDLVRELKGKKAPKPDIDAAVKHLLQLKAQYKTLTGQDWKPGTAPASAPAVPNAAADVSSADVAGLLTQIAAQGDKVRELKSAKADKPSIDAAVKTLLKLKADYKQLTGTDWKPGTTAPSAVAAAAFKVKQEKSPEPAAASAVATLLGKITQQGDKIRELKSTKAEKSLVDAEVKVLLALKTDYKSLTGQEWKPGTVAPTAVVTATIDLTAEQPNTDDVLAKIQSQGDKIRQLKSAKAAKASIDPEVKTLLALKAEYKKLSGKDWTPDAKAEVKEEMAPPAGNEQLTLDINAQGEKVRAAKSSKAAKEIIDAEVSKLLALKAKYKEVTGTDFPVAGRGGGGGGGAVKKAPKEPQPKPAKKESAAAAKPDASSGVKKQTRLGLEASKEDNLPEWYSQVLTKGELIEYYDVSGCYILRPWSYAIWKSIRNWFDAEITRSGVKECYFPIFVSKAALEREKSHIADFSPEVAWVTKSGESDLAEPIAIRPTSETGMYPAYAKWVQSYRDLPIRLNQWNNVVRWEFKHPQPFLRTREFLWQEGHSAFANKSEAEAEVLEMLELYAQVYTDLLAIPVVKGRKTEKEKFAGGNYTTTVEAFISASGRAIQGATSHHLGQNFSKMFDIVYEDPETQQKQFVYQNSWGITTRTIGVMIMVHADNQGLVLPPHVACTQAIVVPCGITVNTKDEERAQLLGACKEIVKNLSRAGVRCEGDYRDNYSPGWKFNHWELKGVPIRIELGPKDMQAKQIVAVRRDTGEKMTIALDDVEKKIPALLETIHQSMLAKAQLDLSTHTKLVKTWSEFCDMLEQKNMLLSPFCGDIACEDQIKADSSRGEEAEEGAPAMGAKSLCTPFDQPAQIADNDKCIHPKCSKKPKFYTLFGRSY